MFSPIRKVSPCLTCCLKLVQYKRRSKGYKKTPSLGDLVRKCGASFATAPDFGSWKLLLEVFVSARVVVMVVGGDQVAPELDFLLFGGGDDFLYTIDVVPGHI
jgi:hypothetical protein